MKKPMAESRALDDRDRSVFGDVFEIIDATRRAAASSVNAVMTAAHWLTGRHIVELEQEGVVKAEYGTALVGRLSADLKRRLGRGFSRPNLWQMRLFCLSYPPEQILQTPSGESNQFPSPTIRQTPSGKSGNPPKRNLPQVSTGQPVDPTILQTPSAESGGSEFMGRQRRLRVRARRAAEQGDGRGVPNRPPGRRDPGGGGRASTRELGVGSYAERRSTERACHRRPIRWMLNSDSNKERTRQ